MRDLAYFRLIEGSELTLATRQPVLEWVALNARSAVEAHYTVLTKEPTPASWFDEHQALGRSADAADDELRAAFPDSPVLPENQSA